MTGAARHDTINLVIDSWNTSKVFRQAKLLADERLDALQLFELHMAVTEDLARQHADEVGEWSRLSRLPQKSRTGEWESAYQHRSTAVITIEDVLSSMVADERLKSASRSTGEDEPPSAARWIHDGIDIERQQMLIIALLKSHREHPLQETWDTITRVRDTLNTALRQFREHQRAIYPRLQLSALDIDEPELTEIQLPSWRIKHHQRLVSSTDPDDVALRAAEIKLRCSQAENGILAVQAASLALSATKKAPKGHLVKDHEINTHNRARDALVDLDHIKKDSDQPFPTLSRRDTRRKETHLHRAKGDSRLFDGTAWYLQSGTKIASKSISSLLQPLSDGASDSEDEPQLLTGTKTLKRSGPQKSPRPAKRVKDILPNTSDEDEAAENGTTNSPGPPQGRTPKRLHKNKSPMKKATKSDGWIWMDSWTKGHISNDSKVAEYKQEADRVQYLRAEAEMYRWLEQYERKHAELWRVIERFGHDATVWEGLANRAEAQNGVASGAVTFARMQAAMSKRLQHNAREQGWAATVDLAWLEVRVVHSVSISLIYSPSNPSLFAGESDTQGGGLYWAETSGVKSAADGPDGKQQGTTRRGQGLLPPPTALRLPQTPPARSPALQSIPIPLLSTCPPCPLQSPSSTQKRCPSARLGPSGLRVPLFSLGGWLTLGGSVVGESVKDIMQAAAENGINMFDTAEDYQKGAAEREMGHAIKELGWRRTDLVISTKIFWSHEPGTGPSDTGLSHKHVIEGHEGLFATAPDGLCRRHLRASLRYHRWVSYIRHKEVNWRRLVPMEEIVRAFNYVIDQGWWSAHQIEEAHHVATRLNLIAPIAEQCKHNMFHRERPEKEYGPFVRQMRPGHNRILCTAGRTADGKYNAGIPDGTRFATVPMFLGATEGPQGEELLWKVRLLSQIAAVILGVSSVAQLEANLGALEVLPKLDAAVLARIEAVLGNHPQEPETYGRPPLDQGIL
ncbi:CxC2 domain-containing protein [Mycena indigotica]|uniref:CxC2 domain-containing protein n=1 Tax=Mycena indigotica TaxID=2126181 RepID=A0A8H6VSJ8_9AGAR|nr:CxC2 domain-containing protein [Mycena indigotica]KAF7288483.1 CxC2 domain-containing protein [Mycena indigotica]